MPNNNPHGHNQYTRGNDKNTNDRSAPSAKEASASHANRRATPAGAPAQEPDAAGTAGATAAQGAGDDMRGAAAAPAAPSRTARRGFASMDQATQREIASKGGHSQGRDNNPGNFANDREKAREAGRKGG